MTFTCTAQHTELSSENPSYPVETDNSQITDTRVIDEQREPPTPTEMLHAVERDSDMMVESQLHSPSTFLYEKVTEEVDPVHGTVQTVVDDGNAPSNPFAHLRRSGRERRPTDKQKHISTSTRDSEMSATFSAVKYVNHFRALLKEMNLLAGKPDPTRSFMEIAPPTVIHQDNMAVIHTLQNNSFKFKETTPGLIDGYTRYIQEQMAYQCVTVEYISTFDQKADIFTKPLGVIDHTRFIPLLSLDPIPLTDPQKRAIIEKQTSKVK